jgi:hypothetical protein
VLFLLSVCGLAYADGHGIVSVVNYNGATSELVLIEVDADSGHVTRSTTTTSLPYLPLLTTMTHNGTSNLYVHIADVGNGSNMLPVHRVNVPLSNLKPTSTKNTRLVANFITGISSAEGTANFLAIVKGNSSFSKVNWKAFGLTNGLFNGDTFRPSPRTDRNFLFGNLSLDGGVSLTGAHLAQGNAGYAQPLKPNGHPDGDPMVFVNVSGIDIVTGAAASNVLAGNRRLLIYRITDNIAPNEFEVYTAWLDATTGDRIGHATLIDSGVYTQALSELLQPVAMDPEGRFAAYTYYTTACGTGGSGVRLVTFDGAGHVNGSEDLIVPCDEPGFYSFGLDAINN